MKTSLKKRICAYLIDIILVTIIFSLLTAFIPDSKNVITLDEQINTLNESFINGSVSMQQYFNQSIILNHNLDKETFLSTLFNFVLMIGYFVILPYYNNGQTLGKKLLKIRVTKDGGKLTINDLIIRNIIVNEFVYTLVALAIVFLASDNIYYWSISILGFIQFLLVIISAFMIIYRKDKKGLQDIISNTKVIEDNVEVKK